MVDSLLGDDFACFVYCELVLAADWIDFRAWDVADTAKQDGVAVA